MNPFADYGAKATSTATPPLVGAIKTRSEARDRYTQVVTMLTACADKSSVNSVLSEIEPFAVQCRAELPLLWEGDGDFAGLRQEIERAQVRVDEGLDYPRYERTETEQ